MIHVYFEHHGISELVAIFRDEETYSSCYQELEKLMIKQGFTKITESWEKDG